MNPGLRPGPRRRARPQRPLVARPAPWGPWAGRGRGSGFEHRRPWGEGRRRRRRGQLGGLCALSRSSHKSHAQFRWSPDHLLNTQVFGRTPEEPGADPGAGDSAGNHTDLAPALGSLESKRGGRAGPKIKVRRAGTRGPEREKQGHATSPREVTWREEEEARNLPQFPSW